MTETKENKDAQLKINEHAKSRVLDLVEILRKQTGKKPTHAMVVAAAMDALEQKCLGEKASKPETQAPRQDTAGSPSQRYRRDNYPWHDRLELVLNDPEEAHGIQKNLEWAERTVKEKQKRPAGKRASGE